MAKAKTKQPDTLADFLSGLISIAGEAADLADDGRVITNAEALQRSLWKQALGWQEETRDDQGNLVVVPHKPLAWAQQTLLELILGKPGKMDKPLATPSNGPLTAEDKIDDLVKAELNRLTDQLLATPPTPPRHKPKRSNGDDLTEEGN
jgi:hypothetical protein